MVSFGVHLLVQHHPELDVIRWIALDVTCLAGLLTIVLWIKGR
jgi:hypothetical protein